MRDSNLGRLLKANTLLSILSAGSRSALFFLCLPLFASHFGQDEFVQWLKVGVIASVVEIIHFGMLSTFSRYYSYSPSALPDVIPGFSKENQQSTIGALFRTHIVIYALVSVIATVLLFSYSYALFASYFERSREVWMILFCALNASLIVQFFGRGLSSMVFGLNQIYKVRWGELCTTLLLGVGIVSLFLMDRMSFEVVILLQALQFFLLGLWCIVVVYKEYLKRNPKRIGQRFSKSIGMNLFANAVKTGVGNGVIVGSIAIVLLFYERFFSGLDELHWLFYRVVNSLGTISQLVLLVSFPIVTKLFVESKVEALVVELRLRSIWHFLVFWGGGVVVGVWLWISNPEVWNEGVQVYLLYLIAWYVFGLGKFSSLLTNMDNQVRSHWFGLAFAALLIGGQVFSLYLPSNLLLPLTVLIAGVIGLYIFSRTVFNSVYVKRILLCDLLIVSSLSTLLIFIPYGR